MKLEGSFTIGAPREAVWGKLMDPASMARVLPGCEKFEPNPAGGFDVALKVGVAAIKGAYQGRFEITDPVPLESCRVKVQGKGAGGFLTAEGALSLTESSGSTIIRYSGDAQVGGPVAAIGQRLIQASARQILNQFFQSFAHAVQDSP